MLKQVIGFGLDVAVGIGCANIGAAVVKETIRLIPGGKVVNGCVFIAGTLGAGVVAQKISDNIKDTLGLNGKEPEKIDWTLEVVKQRGL